jgi:hypothetical protein
LGLAALPAVTDLLSTVKEEWLYWDLVQMLTELEKAEIVAPLLKSLVFTSKNEHRRQEAMKMLVGLGSAALQSLSDLALTSKDSSILESAIEALAALPGSQSVLLHLALLSPLDGIGACAALAFSYQMSMRLRRTLVHENGRISTRLAGPKVDVCLVP